MEQGGEENKPVYKVAENDKMKNETGLGMQVDYSKYGRGFSKDFIDKMRADGKFNRVMEEYIFPNEGGYSNRKNDRGLETKYGISKAAHLNENIKDLTKERATAIYYDEYYKWNGINKLPKQVVGFVMDFGVNSNPQNAVKTVHRVLGIPERATIIGEETLQKIESMGYDEFLERFRNKAIEYYRNIAKKDSTQKEYLRGWLNRAEYMHLSY